MMFSACLIASDRSRDGASWAVEDFGSRSRQLQAHLCNDFTAKSHT